MISVPESHAESRWGLLCVCASVPIVRSSTLALIACDLSMGIEYLVFLDTCIVCQPKMNYWCTL